MAPRAKPILLSTESPDMPTHQTSVGSAMALTVGQEKDRLKGKRLFSEAEAAEKETEALRHEAALRKASGPYQTPEAVGIEWYAQAHPSPWMKWVVMTPEIADFILRERNTDNRPLRHGRVLFYRRIMERNGWRLTHQGVAMDSRGILQDGQHRLAAVVAAGRELGWDKIKVAMAFFVGMDPENFSAIDENLNRSPMDLFAKGGIKYGGQITTIVRLSIAYESQSPRRLMREKQPNDIILDYFSRNDPEAFYSAAHYGVLYARRAYTTAGPLAAAAYQLRKVNGTDNEFVEAFLSGLATGRKAGTRLTLDDDDPRAITRSYFENIKMNPKKVRLPPLEAMGMIFMAWNNVVLGRRTSFMRLGEDWEPPKIIICRDSGPDKSAMPGALHGEVDDD